MPVCSIIRYFTSFCICLWIAKSGLCRDVILVSHGSSCYVIITPAIATAIDLQAAKVVQHYIQKVTGAWLPVMPEQEAGNDSCVISIGATRMAYRIEADAVPDAYIIALHSSRLILKGAVGKGILYAAYVFAEQCLGCRKWSEEAAFTPVMDVIALREGWVLKEAPAFAFRGVYLPAAMDEEYLNWHKLHRLEDAWGLWGHSFEKLVPAAIYYKPHPEYYAFTDGERKPNQLCLSNKKVLQIVVRALEKRMQQHPDALYWSVSPNDDAGHCECYRCRRKDKRDGGAQGSLLCFINRVARHFPRRQFAMLAYGYSAGATLKTIPERNVYILVSSIAAYRTRPLEEEPSAAAFRKNIREWRRITSHVMVWDYCTQFTAYLAPFPVSTVFAANAAYLKRAGVTGVFEQGSGYTYSDMAAYNSYILAAVLWNPQVNTDSLTTTFLTGYYGRAALYVQQYLTCINRQVKAMQPRLDVYGNPVNEHAGYLSAPLLDMYSTLMDKAEAAAEADKVYRQRINCLRLGQEYTVLQQARFWGIEPGGIFEPLGGGFVLRKGIMDRVRRFTRNCEASGVSELSEGGITPEAYLREWEEIAAAGVSPNKALHAFVVLQYAPMEEYPARGNYTLTDGARGYDDFSYNWLCFYDVPMSAVADMGQVKTVSTVTLYFLRDARHWFFSPARLFCDISVDGKLYTRLGEYSWDNPQENFTVKRDSIVITGLPANARFIRVVANQWSALPHWRYQKGKRPAMAFDEIIVQ